MNLPEFPAWEPSFPELFTHGILRVIGNLCLAPQCRSILGGARCDLFEGSGCRAYLIFPVPAFSGGTSWPHFPLSSSVAGSWPADGSSVCFFHLLHCSFSPVPRPQDLAFIGKHPNLYNTRSFCLRSCKMCAVFTLFYKPFYFEIMSYLRVARVARGAPVYPLRH